MHNSPLSYHGNLNTMNCVIDANFIVKIVAIGIEDLLEEWKRSGNISDNTEKPDNLVNERNSPENSSTNSTESKKFYFK